MDTTITMIAEMAEGQHIYTMDLRQGDTHLWFSFEGGSFGWLSMQVAKDGLEDSLENVTIIDETVDPR